jgi:hypothetical protein
MLPPLPCFTQNAFRVDPSTIDVLIEEGTFVLGAEWTSQQLGIDASSRSVEPLPSKSRSNKKLYRPSHEMIGALVEYRMWRSTADYEQIEAPQAVHNLAYLFSMLRNVRGCAGLEHVLHKLRSPREYLGAWFEIFIASQLQKHGSQVRFNPPSHDQHVRSPDLHVTSSEGIEYWAECKYLIGLSDQAVVEKKFMSELVERVHRHWKRVNLNARLTI